MINKNRTIENAWSMLQYLYFELKQFKEINLEGIETMDDLYGIVIAYWCAALAKEGLYKEYVTIEDDELTSPRGQINFQATISQQTMQRGVLICTYDELSDDILINRILKGSMKQLLYNPEICEKVKIEIQKKLIAFNGISDIDMKWVKWKEIKYDNGNLRYKHLIETCNNCFIEQKMIKSHGLDDDRRLYLLFKKQLQKYIQEKYGRKSEDDEHGDLVFKFDQPFTMDEESPFEVKINKVQQMVSIQTETQALVYVIRLEDSDIFSEPKLKRLRLEEVVSYLREYKVEHNVAKVTGCLCYVNINRNRINYQPMTVNVIDGYMVGETTVDIHDQWRFIDSKINEPYKFFIQREKNRKKPWA